MTKPLPVSNVSPGRSAVDDELANLERFITTVHRFGLGIERLFLVNLYVTLKAHASILITGPSGTGKIALVRALGRAFTEAPTVDCQFLAGHARWASKSQDTTKFVELQSRFNDQQILSLIEEASRPENHRRLFIACLTRITPFEIDRYFSSPGFQLWPWFLNRNVSKQGERVIPFPLNFRLLGTMDTNHFQWWDQDLLSQTAVVQWQGSVEKTERHLESAENSSGGTFLDGCIRETSTAYRKLSGLVSGIDGPFVPWLQVTDILSTHGIQVPPPAVKQTIRYLANAWSHEDEGLFASKGETNLGIALDMTLKQYALPWAAATRRISNDLLRDLARMLHDQSLDQPVL